jgi:cystathionine beta-lyase
MNQERSHLPTRLSHAARDEALTSGGVNPVIQRASTVLVKTAEDLYAPDSWTYGRHGTATHEALRLALCELESSPCCSIVSSGLLACTLPLIALATPGDHILVSDSVYGPTRRFCDRRLTRMGCEVEYVDPAIGSEIEEKFRPNTRLVYLESPGSLTFEIADLPAVASACRKAGVVTVVDNTWSAGVYLKPIELGIDISVQSTSKYASGSADTLGGAIFTRDERLAARIKETENDLGLSVSPDEAYLILRGLRTLPVRLERHGASGLEIARWLQDRREVERVLYPALERDRFHHLWKRDFSGATGLVGCVLRPEFTDRTTCFLNNLKLFGLGFSWGGYESLVIHCDPQLKRTVSRSPEPTGPLLRFSIGLEAPADLIADLEQGFAALVSDTRSASQSSV